MTPDEVRAVIELGEAGWSVGRICTEIGFQPEAVKRHLKRAGLFTPSRPEFWTDEIKAALAAMIEDGATTEEIAEELGRTPYAVYCQASKQLLNCRLTANNNQRMAEPKMTDEIADKLNRLAKQNVARVIPKKPVPAPYDLKGLSLAQTPRCRELRVWVE